VSRPVARAPRSTSKRARADDTSSSASSTKKTRPPSTRSGTQAIGSMLLGEHINVLIFLYCLYVSLLEYFFSLDGSVVEILKDDSATLVTH
jgi:hypothetical protein